MQVRGSLEAWREGPINRFLLCSVLAKQTRRLGRLVPEMRVAELIGVAWRNCAEQEIEIVIDGNAPDVIRNEAAQMFLRVELSAIHVGVGQSGRSQTGNGVSIIGREAGAENRPQEGASPSRTNAGVHVSMGAGVDSADSCCALSGMERKYSMSHTNGTDKMRQLQLQALAQNLYILANRHRENGNHIVAHALYGRALEVARGLEISDKEDGTALAHKIQKDQQAVFEILRSGENGARGNPQEKAQKAGQ